MNELLPEDFPLTADADETIEDAALEFCAWREAARVRANRFAREAARARAAARFIARHGHAPNA